MTGMPTPTIVVRYSPAPDAPEMVLLFGRVFMADQDVHLPREALTSRGGHSCDLAAFFEEHPAFVLVSDGGSDA